MPPPTTSTSKVRSVRASRSRVMLDILSLRGRVGRVGQVGGAGVDMQGWASLPDMLAPLAPCHPGAALRIIVNEYEGPDTCRYSVCGADDRRRPRVLEPECSRSRHHPAPGGFPRFFRRPRAVP